MSNPVAVIGLTFASTDLQTVDFGIFLEIVRGLNERPTPRGVDLVVPSRAGRIARNRVGDALTIELRGYVMGATKSAFRTNAQTVRTLFAPSAEPAALVATLENGGTATIAVRSLNSIWDQVTPDLASVSIELESVDPDWVVV